MIKKLKDLTDTEIKNIQAKNRAKKLSDLAAELDFWEECNTVDFNIKASRRVNDEYDYSNAPIAQYFDRIA